VCIILINIKPNSSSLWYKKKERRKAGKIMHVLCIVEILKAEKISLLVLDIHRCARYTVINQKNPGNKDRIETLFM
jgi:hypothetical protein